jgi:uncharacterized RDD family membrane protein YckC
LDYCSRCGKQAPEGAAFCPSCGASLQAGPTPQAQATAPRSGFDALTKDRTAQDYWFRRLIAFVIDAVIVFGIIGVIVAAVTLPALIASQFVPSLTFPVFGFGAGLLSALSGIIFVLYFSFAESIYGASIGKEIMRMQVKTDSGGHPTLASSLLRNISKIYWVLLLLDVVVGLALEADYKRKFSDRFAGTYVTSK